jgi:protein phosphatase
MSELAVQSNAVMVGPSTVTPVKAPECRAALTARSFGLTDRGQVRETNEDQFIIASLIRVLEVHNTSFPHTKVQRSCDHSPLFVVADGMGGHAGGEHASAIAIDSVETFILGTFRWFSQCQGREQDQVLADFRSALGRANSCILAEAIVHPEWRGMGTTLTMAYCLNDVLYVAHAGDSRCYLSRDQHLNRLTTDHTLVADMVLAGAIPAADAPRHRLRHVISNAVGGDSADVKVEVHKVVLEAGDRMLLCTDGLTEMVSEEQMAHILLSDADPEQICKRLVARANDAGGRDNITVIVAHFD